jgi:hypothetical protein
MLRPPATNPSAQQQTEDDQRSHPQIHVSRSVVLPEGECTGGRQQHC